MLFVGASLSRVVRWVAWSWCWRRNEGRAATRHQDHRVQTVHRQHIGRPSPRVTRGLRTFFLHASFLTYSALRTAGSPAVLTHPRSQVIRPSRLHIVTVFVHHTAHSNRACSKPSRSLRLAYEHAPWRAHRAHALGPRQLQHQPSPSTSLSTSHQPPHPSPPSQLYLSASTPTLTLFRLRRRRGDQLRELGRNFG